jgi:eukaryotic-like serine/threonine-protein kinase
VAYELLAGRPPFSERSLQQMLAAHVYESPAPVEVLRADAPPQLASLIRHCLEKNPDARPQSAREILQALDTLGSVERSAAFTRLRRVRGGRAARACRAAVLERWW